MELIFPCKRDKQHETMRQYLTVLKKKILQCGSNPKILHERRLNELQ